jgi:hypothetical protein
VRTRIIAIFAALALVLTGAAIWSGNAQANPHVRNEAKPCPPKNKHCKPTPTPTETTPSPTETTPSPTETTPTPTETTPTPTETTPTETTPPSTYSCVATDPKGRCGPYPDYAKIVGANSWPWVDQNVWTGQAGYSQTLYANSPGDWYIVANADFGNGGILTYPNTGFWMTNTVDSFSSITSTFNTTFPHDDKTIGWAAYDLWLNDWSDEVMIQTDISANQYYNCEAAATATFSGEPWHLCVFGSEKVWKHGTDDAHLINQASGSVDVKEILVWMEQNGYLPANSTWTAGSFGFEVANTSGVDAKFKVNDFTWNAS